MVHICLIHFTKRLQTHTQCVCLHNSIKHVCVHIQSIHSMNNIHKSYYSLTAKSEAFCDCALVCVLVIVRRVLCVQYNLMYE